MTSRIFSCSCHNTGANVGNNNITENPFKSKNTSNFEIIRPKAVQNRLITDYDFPELALKKIVKTLGESCNFEHINEIFDYLEWNPDIHDIVPNLLKFISCELKKENQHRTPILLKALFCLYTNSISAMIDFSICTNALEHFLTKSSTFPGDYVLKDIAADILSDFCALHPNDDLKKHFILQLSRVFQNPNWHSYNLYGGIIGCLSNMSVKSGPEIVPYDEFDSDIFLRHLLSSPKTLRKLFYLCKPFIYNYLPSILIPTIFSNQNSFYDANLRWACLLNLMRNEMLTPIFYMKYDHKFSIHQFDSGLFNYVKSSNLPFNNQEADLIQQGFLAYQGEQMSIIDIDSEESESEKNSQINEMPGDSINIFERERNSQFDYESDSIYSIQSESIVDTDMKSECSIYRKESLQNYQIDSEMISLNGESNNYSDFNWAASSLHPGLEYNDYVKNENSKSQYFQGNEEYLEFLAWKREKSCSDSHKYNKIGESLQIIPPPFYIYRSIFEHKEVNYFHDTHFISSEHFSESVFVNQQCCEKSNTCPVLSSECSSQPDLGIFANINKNIFANWEFKRHKAPRREPHGAEKSGIKVQLPKKSKSRGRKRNIY